MIRIILIVVAFLLMIGAVIGGLYFWGIDPLAQFNALIGKQPPGAVAEAPVAVPPTYVDFGLLVVPVIRDREVKKQAEMIIRLQVPPDRKAMVANRLPRLQAAFLEDMLGFLPNVVRDHQPLDIEAVRRRLVMVGERTMGAGNISDVLVENPSLK